MVWSTPKQKIIGKTDKIPRSFHAKCFLRCFSRLCFKHCREARRSEKAVRSYHCERLRGHQMLNRPSGPNGSRCRCSFLWHSSTKRRPSCLAAFAALGARAPSQPAFRWPGPATRQRCARPALVSATDSVASPGVARVGDPHLPPVSPPEVGILTDCRALTLAWNAKSRFFSSVDDWVKIRVMTTWITM